MVAFYSGLADAAKNPGLVYSVWLLTQVPLAARSDDFAVRLQQLGFDVSAAPDAHVPDAWLFPHDSGIAGGAGKLPQFHRSLRRSRSDDAFSAV